MLNAIIKFSIQNKLIIGLLVLGLIFYGSVELKKLSIDAVPDITNNQVQIITVAPALSAIDIERLITFPIEQANANLPYLKELRSFSRFGLSVITIVFEEEVDIYWARQQIAERLQQVQEVLPKDLAKPFLAPVTTGLGEIYQYVLMPAKGYENVYTPMELRTIQDGIVRKHLLGVEGVAEVSSFGGLLKQYEVAIEPEKLLSYQITVSEVLQALEKNNQNTGGAYIEKGPYAYFIRTEGLMQNIEDIRNTVIKYLPNGLPIFIKDVAQVQIGHAIRYGALTYNGEKQVAGAVVMMLKGENSSKVIQNIKKKISEIQKILPPGVIIEPFLDRTKMVNNAIQTVSHNLIEGALIVVFVLVIFLGNLRAGLLVASVIPLSMLFTIILMNNFGVSGNLMSLGALDFGLIVDGAVIIVEAVLHQVSHHPHYQNLIKISLKEMDTTVQKTSSRMMNSAVFGQIIILLVYLPIFTLKGIEGKMFKPMAQTVIFALLGAFILSLTYVPMMCSLLLRYPNTRFLDFSDKMMKQIEKFYSRMLKLILRYPKPFLAIILVSLGISVIILMNLGGEFIPSIPEGDYAVETRLLASSNLNTTIEVTSKASLILLKNFPEIEKIVTKIGSSEVPTDPMPIYAGDMIIALKKRGEWTSAKTYAELEQKMSKALDALPGLDFGFQYPVAMRFNELMTGAKQDIVCKIFGDNLDTLAHYAQKLAKLCEQIEGTEGLYVEEVTGLPQITIHYDRNKIAQYGLNIQEINQVVNAAFAGQETGAIYEGDKRFSLVVRLKKEKRNDLTDVQNLLIPTSKGTSIPLSMVANIELVHGPNQVQRERGQRRIIVGFNVRGRDIQTTVQELQNKVSHSLHLPSGYLITYGGSFENLQAATERLYFAVPLSLALIFLVLYLALGSISQALLIYSAIPLSAMGGIFSLYLRGIPFSISAGVGFIALFGVAVLNGIVLISEFKRLKNQMNGNDLRVILEATQLRLRPVIMTASVASLGFLPMAISQGEGAEVQRPLATVVIGGLIIATVLTLFVLPILYLSLTRKNYLQLNFSMKTMLLVLGMSFATHAQTPITLKQAIDKAIAQHHLLKNEKLIAEYHQQVTKTAGALPSTQLGLEYGQINSFYRDKRISITQTFQFPTVYKRLKQIYSAEWQNSLLKIDIQKSEIHKMVAQVYASLIYIQQKKSLLLKMDSLWNQYLEKVNLRLQHGETNALEKANAENQRTQIYLQLLDLQQEEKDFQLQFQYLLQTQSTYIPMEKEIPWENTLPDETQFLKSHPLMRYYEQKIQVAKSTTHWVRSLRLPELQLGYNAMSMQGIGADNLAYGKELRFHSTQLGISIPLWAKYHPKIQASEIQEKVAQNEYEWNYQQMQKNYLKAKSQYEHCKKLLQHYEEIVLKNVYQIQQNADNQLNKGNINFLEWMMMVQQVWTIQKEYIETLYRRNQAVIELIYFLEQ